MVVRLAKPEDFANFTHLYSNLNYDMLYQCTPSDLIFDDDFDDEIYQEISEHLKVSEENFLKVLEEEYYKIFIIECSNTIIGTAWLSKISGKRWKLVFLCLLPEFSKNFIEIVSQILNQNGIKELDITPTHSQACKLLEEINAQKVSSFYYRLKQSK